MARPKLGDSESKRLQMVITEDELARIDEWQHAHAIPSRSEAIRRLCQIGLRYDRAADNILEAIRSANRRMDDMASKLEGYAAAASDQGQSDALTVDVFEYMQAIGLNLADVATAFASAELQRLDLTDASMSLAESIEAANKTFERFEPVLVKLERDK